MDLDLALCAVILRHGDLIGVLNAGIQVAHLQGTGREVFADIVAHRRDYGCLPDFDLLCARYPALAGADGSLPKDQPASFFADNIKTRWALSIISEAAKHIVSAIGTRDPDKALDVMKSVLHAAQRVRTKYVNARNLTRDVDERIAQYEKVAQSDGGIDGIPWPWNTMNRETQGIHPGEFHLFTGPAKIGKTVGLTETTYSTAVVSGISPLIVSMEMPPQQLGRRLDARIQKIPYDNLKRGMLGTDGFEAYKTALRENYATLPDVWCYGPPTVRSVADIELLVREHKPGLVLIDSLYLLRESSSREGRFVQTIEQVEAIKPMALGLNVPVVATTQFKQDQKTAQRVRTGAGEVEDMGYGASALSQNTDFVYGIFAPEELRRDSLRLIRFLARREASEDINGFAINWNFTTMDFSEVGLWTGERVIRHEAAAALANVPF